MLLSLTVMCACAVLPILGHSRGARGERSSLLSVPSLSACTCVLYRYWFILYFTGLPASLRSETRFYFMHSFRMIGRVPIPCVPLSASIGRHPIFKVHSLHFMYGIARDASHPPDRLLQQLVSGPSLFSRLVVSPSMLGMLMHIRRVGRVGFPASHFHYFPSLT